MSGNRTHTDSVKVKCILHVNLCLIKHKIAQWDFITFFLRVNDFTRILQLL